MPWLIATQSMGAQRFDRQVVPVELVRHVFMTASTAPMDTDVRQSQPSRMPIVEHRVMKNAPETPR